jgi:hypothetical protein
MVLYSLLYYLSSSLAPSSVVDLFDSFSFRDLAYCPQ